MAWNVIGLFGVPVVAGATLFAYLGALRSVSGTDCELKVFNEGVFTAFCSSGIRTIGLEVTGGWMFFGALVGAGVGWYLNRSSSSN